MFFVLQQTVVGSPLFVPLFFDVKIAFRNCSRLRANCHRVEEIKNRVEDDGRALSAETEQMRAKMDFEVLKFLCLNPFDSSVDVRTNTPAF